MLEAALICANLALAWAVLAWALFPRWPAPAPRPFECFPCRARFRTAQHLTWHEAGQHRADFEPHAYRVTPGRWVFEGGAWTWRRGVD